MHRQPAIATDEEVDLALADAKVKVPLGEFRTTLYRVQMWLDLNAFTGVGQVVMYLDEPNSRRDGRMFGLDQENLDKLRTMLAKADSAVATLRQRGQLRMLKENF